MTINHKSKFGKSSLSLAVSIALSGTLLSSQAFAAEEEAVSEKVEKIAVIGSRSAPRSVGESPVPIDIISSDDLKKKLGFAVKKPQPLNAKGLQGRGTPLRLPLHC